MTRRRCFVISPIGPEGSEIREHADAVYEYYIKPAMDECGFDAFRSDHLSDPGRITEQMFTHILGDDLCVAVLTRQNPNVFYELAIAQAARRPVIVLIEKGEVLPFDVHDLRAVYYDLKPRSVSEKLYKQPIVDHVRSLEASGWQVSPVVDVSLAANERGFQFHPQARTLAADTWRALLDEAADGFDAMGITLGEWKRVRAKQVIEEKSASACRIRILLTHEANPALPALINDDEFLDDVVFTLQRMTSYFRELAEAHENVELRLITRGIPHFNLTRNDRRALVVQYLYGERPSLSPALEVASSSPLYDVFGREFEALWTANPPA